MSEAPPHDIPAEEAVLGAVLADPDVLERVRTIVRPADFFRDGHAQVFGAASALRARGVGVDQVTVAAELERRGVLTSCGGRTRLAELAESVVTTRHAEHYAAIVRETGVKRRVAAFADLLAGHARNGESAAELLTLLRSELRHLEDDEPAPETLAADELLSLDLPATQWIITGLVPAGLTLLAGPPKKGKSWLALFLLVAVATSGRALGSIPVEGGEVLYLALEDTKSRLRERLGRVQRGMSAPMPKSLQLVAAGAWPRIGEGFEERLRGWLRKAEKPRLVVVDTLAMVRPPTSGKRSAYEEDYRALSPLKAIADEYGIAIVVIHHDRKLDAEDPLDKVSGSRGITGSADTIMVLKRPANSSEATLYVRGRDVEEQALALRWDPHVATWTLLGQAGTARLTGERSEILAWIRSKGRPCSPTEVAAALGKNPSTVRTIMVKLAEAGLLRRASYGSYAVSTEAVDAVASVDASPESTSQPSTASTGVTGFARARVREEDPDDDVDLDEKDREASLDHAEPPAWIAELAEVEA